MTTESLMHNKCKRYNGLYHCTSNKLARTCRRKKTG